MWPSCLARTGADLSFTVQDQAEGDCSDLNTTALSIDLGQLLGLSKEGTWGIIARKERCLVRT